jgi:hypothetical protein
MTGAGPLWPARPRSSCPVRFENNGNVRLNHESARIFINLPQCTTRSGPKFFIQLATGHADHRAASFFLLARHTQRAASMIHINVGSWIELEREREWCATTKD